VNRTDASALRRLLSALGSVNIGHQNDDGPFEMTRLGSLLRSDVPRSVQRLDQPPAVQRRI
jgi:hypothetical protein